MYNFKTFVKEQRTRHKWSYNQSQFITQFISGVDGTLEETNKNISATSLFSYPSIYTSNSARVMDGAGQWIINA